MIFLRLLGVGAAYGVGFALIKSLFPSPIILLMFSNTATSDGDPTKLTLVYMGVGLVAGLIAAPIFGGLVLLRGSSSNDDDNRASSSPRIGLSMGLALTMGVISGFLIILVYATGILPPGGVLDPLKIIRSSNFSPGTILLVAWTFARDLIPAGLTGLFLSPIGGGILARLYKPEGRPVQKTYDEDF